MEIVTLPWDIWANPRSTILLLKIDFINDTPKPPPILVTTGTNVVVDGADVYDPKTSTFLSMDELSDQDSELTRNPAEFVLLDDADWTLRTRLENATFLNSLMTAKLVNEENPSQQFFGRTAYGLSFIDAMTNFGPGLSFKFGDPFTRTGDTKIRAADPEIQKAYAQPGEDSYKNTAIPFSGVWGWEG